MHLIKPEDHTRRAFLRRAGQLAMTGAALPMAMNLAAMGEAAAFNATDYKALVCVFLYGGNDCANTVAPYDDASYNAYSAIRGGGPNQSAGGIALSKASLAATLLQPTTSLVGGRQYALHPAMGDMAALFNSGQAAVQLNVGTLVKPLTRAQYDSGNSALYPRPPKLFSHNDQQSIWQSSAPEGARAGWGGGMGDLALAGNASSIFTCISLTGNTVFLSGDSALAYQISPGGAPTVSSLGYKVYDSHAVSQAMIQLVQQTRSHSLENEYNRMMKRAIGASSSMNNALTTVPANTAPFNTFPASGNSLADQLKMVARLIAARHSLGVKRQVFFVSLGGFDMHDKLISQHDIQLGMLSKAMATFYSATAALGVANQVTTFTASDFGRALASNGDGSDHGWGSHHFMVGGAVKGKAFYGTPPPMSVGNTTAAYDQWHIGQGRLLPSTSVDQYAATMARWFGVAEPELAGILPNLKNFGAAAGRPDYPSNMGFMT